MLSCKTTESDKVVIQSLSHSFAANATSALESVTQFSYHVEVCSAVNRECSTSHARWRKYDFKEKKAEITTKRSMKN